MYVYVTSNLHHVCYMCHLNAGVHSYALPQDTLKSAHIETFAHITKIEIQNSHVTVQKVRPRSLDIRTCL
jgi:hypothetical protein